jgi:hypothetical protein
MSESKYRLRLMFEWGGGCLWCDNEAAREAFDVGPIEDILSLSSGVLHRLSELSEWHDGVLNKDYPADPGPWNREDYITFEKAAIEILGRIQEELGTDFYVIYAPLS